MQDFSGVTAVDRTTVGHRFLLRKRPHKCLGAIMEAVGGSGGDGKECVCVAFGRVRGNFLFP
jgi:hypothetical protein